VAFLIAILLALFLLPSPWGVVTVAAAVVFEVGEAAFWVWVSRRRRAQVGAEALIGATAQVVEPCRPEGLVRIHGELWRARCNAGADAGETVRVVALDGLTLVVAAAAPAGSAAGATESEPLPRAPGASPPPAPR
jgi:membrane protein implicated in regulation of membrane protease activity